MLQGFANVTRIVDRYHVYFQNISRLRRISITWINRLAVMKINFANCFIRHPLMTGNNEKELKVS